MGWAGAAGEGLPLGRRSDPQGRSGSTWATTTAVAMPAWLVPPRDRPAPTCCARHLRHHPQTAACCRQRSAGAAPRPPRHRRAAVACTCAGHCKRQRGGMVSSGLPAADTVQARRASGTLHRPRYSRGLQQPQLTNTGSQQVRRTGGRQSSKAAGAKQQALLTQSLRSRRLLAPARTRRRHTPAVHDGMRQQSLKILNMLPGSLAGATSPAAACVRPCRLTHSQLTCPRDGWSKG